MEVKEEDGFVRRRSITCRSKRGGNRELKRRKTVHGRLEIERKWKIIHQGEEDSDEWEENT